MSLYSEKPFNFFEEGIRIAREKNLATFNGVSQAEKALHKGEFLLIIDGDIKEYGPSSVSLEEKVKSDYPNAITFFIGKMT